MGLDVAIAGSSGLLGTRLRDALRRRGDTPVRLVRPATDDTEGDTIRWEPREGRIDAAGLDGVDAVVNLAGEPLLGRWTNSKRERIRRSRVDATRLLVGTLAELTDPPAVMLGGSAVGYYGSRGDEILTEQAEPGQGWLAEVVQAWEDAARPAADAGVRVALLRTGLVQSPEADLLRLQLLPFRLGLGGKLSTGRQWFPWIHIDDHVDAMLRLLDDDRGRGPFNLSAPNPVRQGDYARTLGAVLGRPALLTVPKPAVSLVFGATAAEELATASQRVVPERLVEELGFTFGHPTLGGALRDLLDRPAA